MCRRDLNDVLVERLGSFERGGVEYSSGIWRIKEQL